MDRQRNRKESQKKIMREWEIDIFNDGGRPGKDTKKNRGVTNGQSDEETKRLTHREIDMNR